MEDNNEKFNAPLPSSELEQLIEGRSGEMPSMTEICEESNPDIPGSVTSKEDSSDIDLRSDENSPSNEVHDVEINQHTPDSNTTQNEPQEKEFPISFDLVLQPPRMDIQEPECSERKLSEPQVFENESLELEITQVSEESPESITIEVPGLSSPSPEPIEIGIPGQSGSSPEPTEIEIHEPSDIPPDQPDHKPQDQSGSDADNEYSDDETPRALGKWQLRQLAENALEIALEASTQNPSSQSPSDPNTCTPRTPLPERVWRPSTTDPTQANKPKCPPCERKKKRFDCLGIPPCNECSKRNMTAEQCASYAPVRRRGKRRIQDDDGMVTQRGGKRGKRR